MLITFCRDHPTPGGGVLGYVKNNISTPRLINVEAYDKEAIWLLLKPKRTQQPFSVIVVVGIYYPPGQTAEKEKEMNEYLTMGLVKVLQDYPSGDFNPMKLTVLCRRFNLKKAVRQPTRGQNVLHQILTNMSELYNDVTYLPPDQCLVYCMGTEEYGRPCSCKIRLVKTNKLASLGVELDQEDWKSVLNAQDIDEKVTNFSCIVVQLLGEILPKTTIRTHGSDKPWMASNIKREIKARQKAYINGNKTKYKELSDKVSPLIVKARMNYYRSKAEGQRKSNPTKWYKDIYRMAGIYTTDHTNNVTRDQITSTVELLQDSFIKP